MLPCPKCISFAICNSQEERVTCSILYNYFIEGGIQTEYHHGSSYYTSPQTDRLKEVIEFFNRKLLNWSLSTEEPIFKSGAHEITFYWDNSPPRVGLKPEEASLHYIK